MLCVRRPEGRGRGERWWVPDGGEERRKGKRKVKGGGRKGKERKRGKEEKGKRRKGERKEKGERSSAVTCHSSLPSFSCVFLMF